MDDSDRTPFTVDIDEEAVHDLRARIRATRWPDAETVDDWSQGVRTEYLRDLAVYWSEKYDPARIATRLNRHPQEIVRVDGLDLHVVHVRSPHPGALPLLLTHGWPSTVAEFDGVIDALTGPPDPADAFHLVIPSLPGHGFSARPTGTGWGVPRIAQAWAELMAVLGYDRYGAHGGDWGSWITGVLGQVDAPHLAGLHLTMPMAPACEVTGELSERDQAAFAKMQGFGRNRSAYAAVQSTRPQSLGFGLHDSPVGQLAWILDRFWEWADHDGDLASVVDRDVLLDIVTTYWLTGTATSAARLFWESFGTDPMARVDVPTGASVFPNDAWMPRVWCEQRFTDLRYWRDLPDGGHFPAIERPDVLVEEIRTFFHLVR